MLIELVFDLNAFEMPRGAIVIYFLISKVGTSWNLMAIRLNLNFETWRLVRRSQIHFQERNFEVMGSKRSIKVINQSKWVNQYNSATIYDRNLFKTNRIFAFFNEIFRLFCTNDFSKLCYKIIKLGLNLWNQPSFITFERNLSHESCQAQA